MNKILGVQFPYSLKIFEYNAGNFEVKARDKVIVESTQGVEIGEVIYIGKKSKSDEALTEIIRIANEDDLKKQKELEEKSKELFPLFKEKIEKHELKMTPVGCGYSMDESKAVFYFTAEGRIDFRELARDLSRTIQKQAILRQIGPRDEAKIVGGYGRCGRPICCGSFLCSAEGVSMERVEKQFGAPKNASKISGLCGRLMCCLNFEEGNEKIVKGESKVD